jgi:hypothetical protein
VIATVAKPRAEPLPPPAPPPPSEHWYFEWLSQDGKRALLRRIDASARTLFAARVVDVDTGATVEEATLAELGKLPSTTIGRPASDLEALDAALGAPVFGQDLVKGAHIAGPFGSCGRFSAAPTGSAIAFNAGDWLYMADKGGKVKKRVATEAAYDPRFTPDGKHLLFRRASGKVDKVLARYELFVVPADLSAPARALVGTAGVRERVTIDRQGRSAVTIVSNEPQIKTCALSVSLKAPFAVKRLGCLDGGEQLVDSVLSPTGRWAAMMTQRSEKKGPARSLAWRLRVLSLETGKVMLDEPALPGLSIRAISDAGLLVESGGGEAVLVDVPKKSRKHRELDVGHRGYFRSPSELVVVRGASVAVVDVTEK